jgi:hypothetical protein
MTRAAKPVTKPVGATRVLAKTSSSKKLPAKKQPVKKSAAKKAAPKRADKKPAKPKTVKQAYKKRSTNVRTGVLKRKATIATTRRGIDRATRVDASDEIGSALVDKANAAWELAAERVPQGDVAEPVPSARVKRSATERADDPPPATGIALVERVTRAVERELSQIEVIVGGHHVKPGQRTEAERRARTLASLARTLTEVRKLRAEEDKLKPQHDDGPEDIDEFRRALSQKLDRLVRESKEIYPEESDRAGDA